MWQGIERGLTVVMAIAAVIITVTVLRGPSQAVITPGVSPPDSLDVWEEAIPISMTLGGNDDAPVKIIVLSDLECPACAAFHSDLKVVLEERGSDVHAMFVNFPLSYHRFAMAAAKAATCANEVGALRPWVDMIYSKQDSLGIKSWGDFARAAGIPGADYIEQCAMSANADPLIDAGLAFAEKIVASATPTVIINGWRYTGPPSTQELNAKIDEILSEDDRN